MDKQSLLNKISFILQDLKAQHLKLTGNVDRIPEIDLDLFLANASFLVNHLEVLKKINGTSPEVRERDDILKNLFNPKELERLLEQPSNNELGKEDKEIEKKSLNEVLKAKFNNESDSEREEADRTIEIPKTSSEFSDQEDVVEITAAPLSQIKTRNESFLETQNNFIKPLSNKQGVFAPELERKAAYLADKNEIPEVSIPKDEFITPSEEDAKPIYPEVEIKNSFKDAFNDELKSLREINHQSEIGQNLSGVPISPEYADPQISGSESVLKGNTYSNRPLELPNKELSQGGNLESSAKTYNDFIVGQKREPSLLNKLGNLPVKDIRKAIGLNEHLLFIKTLFHGDPAIYDRTLTMIDTFNTADQAFQFLNNEIAGPFNWEAKKAVAELFKNIVNRKFAGNR